MKQIFVFLLLIGQCVFAGDDHVWLVGGGPNVFRSQVQIESNMLWVLQAIDGIPGDREIGVYFTDGHERTPDIHAWSAPPPTAASLQPLALVFDDYWSNGLVFRNHRIPGVAGTSEAEPLRQAIEGRIKPLSPEDTLWFLFMGHGSFREDFNNGLELWNDTVLTVDEVGALLDGAPEQSRIRFLFPQCYSGAFAELARPGSARCGFMAAGADQVSEGCSPAIEKRDYEDYSTYFFAALTGRPRNHAGLDGRPDWDSDGVVTPLEAHFHVLATAFSADIPRSTSEALLLTWQAEAPLDLLADGRQDANEYLQLAREMMRGQGIDPDAPGKQMGQRMLRLQEQSEELEKQWEEVRTEISMRQQRLRTEVLRRWPQTAAAHTRGFKRFLETDLDAAQAYIQAHPDYAELRRGQDVFWELDDAALRLRRERNQLLKIEHLLRLGRLKIALERDGPEALKDYYRALRVCEAAPF